MYINTTALTQHSEQDIRALFSNTSFPVPFIAPNGYALVFPSPKPVHSTITQSVTEAAPELTAMGHWEQRWNVIEVFLTQAEKDAAIAANLLTKITSKSEFIKAERDKRKSGGVLVSGKWFHTDSDSRIQQLGLVLMGANVPAVQWKTMDGSFTAMTPTLAGAIFQAVAGLDMGLFANAETLSIAIKASTTPDSFDVTVGWPAKFVGV